ncbi:MAG: metallophosphoesterase [Bacteroidota bacterium]
MPLLILVLLLDWLAFQIIQPVIGEWSVISKSIVHTIYWMIPIIVLGITVSFNNNRTANWDKRKFSFVRSFIILTYFSKFLILAFFLLGLLLNFLGTILFEYILNNPLAMDWLSGNTIQKLAVMMGAIPFFVLLYGIIRNKYRYKIYPTTVEIENLPDSLDGLKIIQISDIHSGSFTEKAPIRNAIQMINEQQADLVFFTGDLVNSIANEMEPFMDVFDKIKARYGVFSILGNHDYGDYIRWESREAKLQNFEKLKSIHQQLGWDLILNGNRILDIKGEEVAVIGVENYSAHGRFNKYGNLEKAYEGASRAVLKLLLSHDPSHWEDEVLKKFKDIDITFSGHTHGAQFGLEIPGLIKWSPIKYVYKQWAGLYRKNAQFLYVNRGFGFLGYPGRVGILPEITVMKLKKR